MTRFFHLKVAEVASEDHGRWNSARLQSHPRGFWELHLHADQWPADPAHSLGQPHSNAYVSVCTHESLKYTIYLLAFILLET